MRVSMDQPAEVVRAVRQAAEAQAVVLTRGGGQSVHDLDAEELIEAVAASPAPVLAALGHASDDLVVARVADASFATPTALGVWLRDAVERKRGRTRQLQEAALLTRSEELLGQLGQLQAVQRLLARWRAAAVIATVLLGATLAYLVLRVQ